ncbi:MAG: YceD family protein [Geminicoccaceae bacterium]
MAPIIEFSHIVSIEPWPADGIVVDLNASDVERGSLLERFQLIELRSLCAKGKIVRVGGMLHLSGEIEAEAVQSCVVTLNPVVSIVRTPFERRYQSGDRQAGAEKEGVPAIGVDQPISEDTVDIEMLDRDEIDVGAVVAEEFYLALDPYPRDAGADEVMAERQRRERDDVSDSPFAELRRH